MTVETGALSTVTHGRMVSSTRSSTVANGVVDCHWCCVDSSTRMQRVIIHAHSVVGSVTKFFAFWRKSANTQWIEACCVSSRREITMRVQTLAGIVSLAALWCGLQEGVMSQTSQSAGARSVVLVHGGWVDGSGWEGVYKALKKDGYEVSIVQNASIAVNAVLP